MRLLCFTSCLCAWLLLLPSARADDAVPRLPRLMLGGTLGSLSGGAAGTALTFGLAILRHKESPTQEYADVDGGLLGIFLGAATLPFWTAGGVKLAAQQAGYDVSYGRALAGSWLGMATYVPILIAGLWVSNYFKRLSAWLLGVGALATVFATMPALSGVLARTSAHAEPSARAGSGLSAMAFKF